MIRQRLWMSAGLGLVALLGACQVDKEAFHRRIFSCNPSAANPACGTDLQDRAMACVAAYQLGGRNFCATGCDVATEPAESAEAICLPSGDPHPQTGGVSGARLSRCDPSRTGNTCNHEELTCLRTDLLVDEGVCTTVNSCHKDEDCRDPVRSKCMGTLLRDTYGAKSELKADHTYCLQAACRAQGSACSPGESCLRDILPASSTPADICVPNCDAHGNCPPNYFCYPGLYSRNVPAICIPGLIGLRCRSRLDCLWGDCLETGAGFKVCSTACQSNADCQKFDSIQGTFFCNAQGHCAGARAFRGAQCEASADCLHPGEVCARLAPGRYGTCLQTCSTGVCPAYGGVPHACRPQVDATGNLQLSQEVDWVCWPGYLGQLCTDDSQCLPGLTCLARPAAGPPLGICSAICQSDADCDANRFAADGWCDPGVGLCRAALPENAACQRERQCESRTCLGMEGQKKCGAPPY